jgi:hypothetical protein
MCQAREKLNIFFTDETWVTTLHSENAGKDLEYEESWTQLT